jgi:hypothetical protein
MVQSPVNEAVSVIAMRHGLMPAASVVAITTDWGAGRRIRLVHGQYMLVVVVAVSRVEMPVVQVVVVVTMRDARMAARLTVDMGMTGMGVMVVHLSPRWMLHPQPIGLDGEEIGTGCELKGSALRRTYG